MMRRRFFVDRFDVSTAVLRGEAGEHLGRVLRAERGQIYELSDGEVVWLGRIERVALSKSGSQIDFILIEQIPTREPVLNVHLLLSIVKFDRFEWCLEKATELGVAMVVPLSAARTDKPLLSAAAKRRARWEKILVESARQARRLRPPVLCPLARSSDAFEQSSAPLKILLSERPDAVPIGRVLQNARANSAALAIGPEGGWTDAEIAAAGAVGFAGASLGDSILRTETAVIAALSIVHFALGEVLHVGRAQE
jgi:16S rRNA (uracil1498-N3)-methyltransferase